MLKGRAQQLKAITKLYIYIYLVYCFNEHYPLILESSRREVSGRLGFGVGS